MKRNWLTILIFLIISSFTYSQNNIRGIQLKPLESTSFSTIVPLGKTLELSFDDLNADQKEYWYKIEHMTYDWKPSEISSNEYIDGFDKYQINNYENSFNTLQDYTHYTVRIPNNNTKITKSGNYQISILDENSNLLFSRKCTFYKKNVVVGVSILRSKNTMLKNQQQTVHFTVNYNPNTIRNPSQEIKAVILQNNNWRTALTDIKPQFFRNNQLVYKYYDKTNFWSGNEYLNFDNKQIRNSTVQIAKVDKKNIYHSYLYPQERRNHKSYTYFPDINGQFLIRTVNGNNNSTEADYAKVYFTLNSEKLNNKEVYIYGAFNNFSLTKENRMTYNTANNTYQASILLKQGFYNYTFVTKSKNKPVNLHELNGSFNETENEYTVIIYYRPFGEYYDQVIGVGAGFINQKQ